MNEARRGFRGQIACYQNEAKASRPGKKLSSGGMATSSWPCGGALASKAMPTKTRACHPETLRLTLLLYFQGDYVCHAARLSSLSAVA
jgi:hypothetical protein